MSLERRQIISREISSIEARKKDLRYLNSAIPLLSRHLLYDNPDSREEVRGYSLLKRIELEHNDSSDLAKIAINERWKKVGFYSRNEYDGHQSVDPVDNISDRQQAAIVALAKRFSNPNARPLTIKQFVDEFFPLSVSRDAALHVLGSLKELYILTEDGKYKPVVREKRGIVSMPDATHKALAIHMPVLEVIAYKDPADSQRIEIEKTIKESTVRVLEAGGRFFNQDHIKKLTKKQKSGSTFSFEGSSRLIEGNAKPGLSGEQNFAISIRNRHSKEEGTLGVNDDNIFEVTGSLIPHLSQGLENANEIRVDEGGTTIYWVEIPQIENKIYTSVFFPAFNTEHSSISIRIENLAIGEELSKDEPDSSYSFRVDKKRSHEMEYGGFELGELEKISLYYPQSTKFVYGTTDQNIVIIFTGEGWKKELIIPRNFNSVAIAKELESKARSLLNGIEEEVKNGSKGEIVEIFDASSSEFVQKSPAELRAEIEKELASLQESEKEWLIDGIKDIINARKRVDYSRKHNSNELKYDEDRLKKALFYIKEPNRWDFRNEGQTESLFKLLRVIYAPEWSDNQVIGIPEPQGPDGWNPDNTPINKLF